jgi:hypothetical protein
MDGSPGDERSSHGLDFVALHRPVTPAVKTVRNSIGKDEIFVTPEHAILRPARQQVPESISHGRHRRDETAIDSKFTRAGIHSITWPGCDGFEDVPVLAITARAGTDVRSRGHGNAKLDQLSDSGRSAAAKV